MSYHGNHVGKLDALGRPHIKKPNPKKELMRKYWYEGPLSQMFQPYTDTDFCMACGIKTTTDRAHILAQSEKGSHQFNNIHLLCKDCHGESEMMEGLHYWAWLMVNEAGALEVTSTPNQDNPLMTQCVDRPGTPILGMDVWEHAYYLNYQNRRTDYIQAFLGLVNWEAVAARLEGAMGQVR